MFDSISKVWGDVADESEADRSVSFSYSTRGPDLRRRTEHYIHYDKPRSSLLKNRLDRVRQSSSSSQIKRHGSPRILKPVSDVRAQRLNNAENKSTGLWGALGKLSKVFKTEDSELGTMKNYMNSMVGQGGDVPGRTIKRPIDLADSRIESLKRRASSVNDRAARFASENASPEKKRVRITQPENTERPHIQRIVLKDLEDLESSRDNIVEKIQRTRKNTLLAPHHRTPLPSALRGPPSTKTTPTTFNINDIPSSPLREGTYAAATASTPPVTINDSVNISQNTLNQLTMKLELLENTVESLKEELKESKEKSQHLEYSLNEVKREQTQMDNTILKSEEMEKIELYEPDASSLRASTPTVSTQHNTRLNSKLSQDHMKATEEDEFEEVNRSLSPVKLDLHKFKYVQ